MILFFKLLLAHLLGDFVLQPGSWVKAKESEKFKSPFLYLHGLVHFVLMSVLVWDSSLISVALAISISHIAIDAIKLQYQNDRSRRAWFFADQALHIIILIFAAWAIESPSIATETNFIEKMLVIITGVLILLMPSSFGIKLVLSKWTPATEFKTDKIETSSLLHAGMMIGYLERVLVFIFILNNQWAAIGFLVTAKSVFRFSDMKLGQDRKLTEYILIGTLLSFGIAILTGLAISYALDVTGLNSPTNTAPLNPLFPDF